MDIFSRRAVSNLLRRFPLGARRTADFHILVPKAPRNRKSVRLVLCMGRSLMQGALSVSRLSDTCPFPDNLKMLEVVDDGHQPGVSQQGPHSVGRAYTGNVVPLLDSDPARTNPSVPNPVPGQGNISFPPGPATTLIPALGEQMILHQLAYGMTLDAMPEYIFVNVAHGGKETWKMGPGCWPWDLREAAITAAMAYADRIGADFDGIDVYVGGHADAPSAPWWKQQPTDAQFDLTPEDHCAHVMQLREMSAAQWRRLTGKPHLDPWFFVTQDGWDYGAGWRQPNLRKSVTATGTPMAVDLHPKIVGLCPEFPGEQADTLHKTDRGYDSYGGEMAIEIVRTLNGWGTGDRIRVKAAELLAPNIAKLKFTTPYGPNYFQQYTPSVVGLVSGGDDFAVGDEVTVPSMTVPLRARITRIVDDAATGPVAADGFVILNAGSHASDLTGTLDAVAQIVGATGDKDIVEIVYAGDDAARYPGGYASPVLPAGSYTEAPLFIGTDYDGGGKPTKVSLFRAGTLLADPSEPFGLAGLGIGANATGQFVRRGHGLQFDVVCYKQFGTTFSPQYITGSNIVAGGDGYILDDVMTPVGGTLAPNGKPARYVPISLSGSLIDGAPVVTLQCVFGGEYEVLPPHSPATFTIARTTGPAASGLQANLFPGPLPIHDPGQHGISVDTPAAPTGGILGFAVRNGMRPPRLPKMYWVDDEGRKGAALILHADQPFSYETWIGLGQWSANGLGGDVGGRIDIVAAAMPGAKARSFGLLPQPRAWRDSVRLPVPDGIQVHDTPILPNTDYLISDYGLGMQALASGVGLEIAAGHRAYRGAGGGQVGLIAGNRRPRAIKFGRVEGDTSTASLTLAVTIRGDEVIPLLGRPLSEGIHLIKGADFTGAVLLRARCYDSESAAYSGGIPSGTVALLFSLAGLDSELTTDWDAVVQPAGGGPTSELLFGTAAETGDLVVPASTRMICFTVEIVSQTATPAGANHWIAFEEMRINAGTVDRRYRPAPIAVDRARLGLALPAGYLDLTDGVTAPATVAGRTRLYTDTADGDLKVRFGDGTTKTISSDT